MITEYVKIMDGFYVARIYVKHKGWTICSNKIYVKTTDGLYVVRDIC